MDIFGCTLVSIFLYIAPYLSTVKDKYVINELFLHWLFYCIHLFVLVWCNACLCSFYIDYILTFILRILAVPLCINSPVQHTRPITIVPQTVLRFIFQHPPTFALSSKNNAFYTILLSLLNCLFKNNWNVTSSIVIISCFLLYTSTVFCSQHYYKILIGICIYHLFIYLAINHLLFFLHIYIPIGRERENTAF